MSFFSPSQQSSETTSGGIIYNTHHNTICNSILSRSSQYYLGAEDDSLPDLDLDWSQFPEELRPNFGKKKKMMKSSVKRNIAKKKSNVDIETTLSNLEQKENKAEAEGEAKQEVDEDSEEEGEEGKHSEQESEAEEPDEEMDGGTDYANNYFDNGEDYVDDEDDNLDEGGIYWNVEYWMK